MRPEHGRPLDMRGLKKLLERKSEPGMWRSLEELARTPEFQESARYEFPWRAAGDERGIGRRDFGKYLAAALAAAGLSGCTRQPPERIVPYVNQPEAITQGLPLYFATAMPFSGHALGLVVKSHMGHPIKVEGNPRHPASLGATDYFAQTSLMDLYDPERSATVIYQGRISTWIDFIGGIRDVLDDQRWNGGARVRLLTGTVISPSLGSQIEAFLRMFPNARWRQWEPIAEDGARAGSRLAFGQFINTYYRFDLADRILAIDSDFLGCGATDVRYAHDFALRRPSRTSPDRVSRMYVVETAPTNTGGSADHRLALRASEIEPFVRGLAQRLGVAGGMPARPEHEKWISVLAEDLGQHRGASIVIPGYAQSATVHALAQAINIALGNAGKTVIHTDPIEVEPAVQLDSIRELVAEMNAGNVDVLIMLGGNPVYDAPADLYFAGALSKVKHRVHLSLYDDETSAMCEWHIPRTHFLEEWSDCVAFDGTASIIQPLIAPVYLGRSAHEMMAALLGQPDAKPYDIVRGYWKQRSGAADFEMFWRTSLHDGVVPNTALPPRNVAVTAGFSSQIAPKPEALRTAGGNALEILFRPDPTIWDGRFASNGYLQELAKPVSKITWDAVALVSPATATRIGMYSYAVAKLKYRGREIQFPLWVQPGQADHCITVYLGYGRTRAGRTGNTGFDAYPLRTSDTLWWGPGLTVSGTNTNIELACTQTHQKMDGRFPVRLGSLDRYRQDAQFANKEPFEPPPAPGTTLYPEWRYPGYKWGMAIDLNACVGCNACVSACDMENNIAIVGKDEVFRYREMHWLRVDRYFYGGAQNPMILFQPVLCMHCENAPCEPVCPVEATVHSSEGLNQMVYNRCVGTRYCSNNCPYKVRRFNFFLYSDWYNKPLELMRNPEVTVRSRGVMEKCTYCVQRIERAKINAEVEDRPVRDGEIKTACQQACPADAIVFGNLNDKDSQVSKLKAQSLNYGLLAGLNTRPRTTYLARVMNLNPRLKSRLV